MHSHHYRTIVPHARRIGQRGLTVILLVVVLLTGMSWAGSVGTQRVTSAATPPHPLPASPIPASDTLTPFLDIVPASDGRGIIVSARGIGGLESTLLATVGIGPGGKKNSYTMTYNETVESYGTFVPGFDPGNDIAGTVSLSTTQGIATQTVWFDRLHIDTKSESSFVSNDGLLRMSWISPGTLPTDTYIAITPGMAPPGPIPAGHQAVGNVYTVRASGSLVTANGPLLLEMAYDPTILGSIDPRTLDIAFWDASIQPPRWERLNARLDDETRTLSVSTSRFGSYTVLVTPSWRDTFVRSSGLATRTNVTTDLDGNLTLSSAPGTGTAISVPITPPAPFEAWESLSFTAASTPPDTSVTIDVLDAQGTVLLADVANGVSLHGVDPAQHPTLVLRASLTAMTDTAVPTLGEWNITWTTAGSHVVYLPAIIR